MAVVLYSFLQLPTLLVHISQIGVGLCKHGVLFDGQGAEVSGPGKQMEENNSKTPEVFARKGGIRREEIRNLF